MTPGERFLLAKIRVLEKKLASAGGGGGVDPHASSHEAGGSDPIKLDDFAAPDDNTDLDASTAKHGLMPKWTSALISALLDLISTTRGAILYRGASAWAALNPGTSGDVLTSNGAGSDPSYQTPSGGGAPHAADHEDGGSDEIDVTGLSGLLADPQTPAAHGNEAHTETFSTEAYVQEQIANLNLGGATQNTFLVSGGQIVWIEDYDYIVSAASYYINGVLYASPQTPITLTAADVTNDRIDVVAVDDQGDVIVIDGTPAAQPAEPDVDPSTQLKLGIVFVAAATTEPGTATTVPVYAENAGSPGEWDWTSSGSGWNLASTNNPRTGSTDIEATNVSSGAFIQGQIGTGTFDPNAYQQLVLYIRSKANWTNNRTMQIRLQNAGAVVGQTLSIGNGQFGFNAANTTDYQQIAIPISQFAVPSGQVITQVRLTRAGGSTIGFYVDDVSFVGGAVTQPASGITQAQADARYAPLGPGFVTIAAEAGLPNERRLTAGDGISLTDGGVNSTLTVATRSKESIDIHSGELHLVGDDASPGNNKVYGTDGSGNKGWQSASTGSGTERFVHVTLIGADGGDITTGRKRVDVTLPDGEITAAELTSPDTGDIVIDVLVGDFSTYPTASSITGSTPPELDGADKSEDTTLSGWTTGVSFGQKLDVEVLSCSGITKAVLVLTVEP